MKIVFADLQELNVSNVLREVRRIDGVPKETLSITIAPENLNSITFEQVVDMVTPDNIVNITIVDDSSAEIITLSSYKEVSLITQFFSDETQSVTIRLTE